MLLGTQRINPAGHLEIGGCDAVRLAAEFGTPLYVMDEDAIRGRLREYRAAFDSAWPETEIYYASKAFLSLAIARIVDDEGMAMDVASGGELALALAAGFPADRIAVHGSNKSREELQAALDAGVRHIVLDNFHEIDLLGDLAPAGRLVDVTVRVAPGLDPRTHRLIRTGQADTKFGFNLGNGDAMLAAQLVCAHPNMALRGVHCHIGSQLLDTETHEEAADVLVRFAAQVEAACGVRVGEVNIGGGLGVRYRPSDRPPSIADLADRVAAAMHHAVRDTGIEPPALGLEPGRSIVGEAGTTLYTVGAVKRAPAEGGDRIYASVDGGLSDNPRPQMYEAKHACMLANRPGAEAAGVVTVAGKHCETDILIWDAPIVEPRPGDILAISSTGAYNHAMASNYNRFPRPAVVLVQDGRADVIVRRETLEEMAAREVMPARLHGAVPAC